VPVSNHALCAGLPAGRLDANHFWMSAKAVLDSLRTGGRDSLCMVLRTAGTSARCPCCSKSSYRIHSRYKRTIANLPWEDIPVRIELRARRFFCASLDCEQRIFTERLPQTVARHGRRTCRLGESLGRIVMALGGGAGSRLAWQLGILASGSTLLRQIRRKHECNTTRFPRVLGIDDWAWRKGHRYGTILCDLEASKVVDLPPDREANTVVDWLQAAGASRHGNRQPRSRQCLCRRSTQGRAAGSPGG